MEYTLLSELSLQCQNCKIKVRICRIWESTAPFLKGDIFENHRYNDTALTDVLGQISAISEITQKYVGQTLTPIRNLEIQDLEKNVLSVTLWDQFALDFDDDDILEKERNRPIIIVLAGMMFALLEKGYIYRHVQPQKFTLT
uniref:Replication protein A OB domain-containing protein n=1 Tax=Ananas comosus var. bracteatus TaxID=296719 RepID=A0A6V7PGH2_ANACO|nr:unnamed protein product [Ananas comosus var. bracteatus]